MERILLVEDDSAIYQPLTSFLRGEGFAVRQASGQREALALLETARTTISPSPSARGSLSRASAACCAGRGGYSPFWTSARFVSTPSAPA